MGCCIPRLGGKLQRVFVCVKLPRERLDMLSSWLSSKERANIGVRWARPETIHITLKFCGEIQPDAVNAIRNLLRKENLGSALSLSVEGIGGYPDLRDARVIWTSVSGDVEKLNELARRVENCAHRCGVEKEKRKFRAHITLGRRNARGAFSDSALAAVTEDEINLPPFTAGEIIMMESRLTPDGPIYTPLERFPLSRAF